MVLKYNKWIIFSDIIIRRMLSILTCLRSWHWWTWDSCRRNQNHAMVHNCIKNSLSGNQYSQTNSHQNTERKRELILTLWSSRHLSESNIKCWLPESLSAFAKSLLSASTIEIFPQTTWITKSIYAIVV